MRSVSCLILALGTLLLAACGGGGGGSDAPAAPSLTVGITSGNQGAVARAAIDGGQALSASQPLASDGRATAQSLGAMPAAGRIGVVEAVIQRALAEGLAPRRGVGIASAMRPAATHSSTANCGVSGSVTTTIDDHDNSNALSGGDLLGIVFNQCKDTADGLLDGAMVFTIGSVQSSTNVQFSGSLSFVQVTAVDGQTSASINGSVAVTAVSTSSDVQMTLTVGASSLTVTSSAPGYTDTIVYDPGMQVVVGTNATTASSVVTLNGSFFAASIGGRVGVTTLQPVAQLATDLHPSSGQIRVSGAAGSQLLVTALNSTQVRLELDANGDGTYETAAVVVWNSLGSI